MNSRRNPKKHTCTYCVDSLNLLPKMMRMMMRSNNQVNVPLQYFFLFICTYYMYVSRYHDTLYLTTSHDESSRRFSFYHIILKERSIRCMWVNWEAKYKQQFTPKHIKINKYLYWFNYLLGCEELQKKFFFCSSKK